MTAFEDRHLDGVIALCHQEGWPTYPANPQRALQALLAPGSTTVVALDEAGQVIGFAHGFGDGTTAYLAQLLVEPAHRGHGVGRRLVDDLAERSRAERLDLLTDTAEGFYVSSFAHRAYRGMRLFPGWPADGDAHDQPADPVLEGDGIVLRPWALNDSALVVAAARDPLIPLITTVPAGADQDAARTWIQVQHTRPRTGLGHSFAIADATTDTALGQIGLWPGRVGPGRASIGYWIEATHRGRGLATRALTAIADWGLRQPELRRLELYVEPWNQGSWRAAERAGFHREGLLRSWETVGDQPRDMYMYSRLADR